MTDATNLPPCRLCGQPPVIVEWLPYAETLVYCASPGCGIREDRMTADEWRRLHVPRLAPEHVESLATLLKLIGPNHRWSDAIRAALVALGEDGHGISRAAVLGEIDSIESAIQCGDSDRALRSVQSLRSAVGEMHELI